VERHRMVKVLPLASDFLVLLRQQFSRFIAALAALLATGDEFLRLHQGFLGRAGVAWGLDALSIRRDEKHLQADINPGFTTCQGQRLNGKLGAGAADLPAIGFVTARHGLDRAHNLTRPAYGDTAYLGQHQATSSTSCAVAVVLLGARVLP